MINNCFDILRIYCCYTCAREGCRRKRRAWNELGVSMVCCRDKAGCGGATEPWRNHGSDIFLRAFWAIVTGLPAGDVMIITILYFSISHQFKSVHFYDKKEKTNC